MLYSSWSWSRTGRLRSQSMCGCEMPSTNPNGSTPCKSDVDRRSMRTNPAPHCASISCSHAASRPERAYRSTATCGTRSPAPHFQPRGSLAPISPRRRARAASLAIPATNSSENLVSRSGATSNARSPSLVRATWSAVSGSGSALTALVTGACASHARAAAGSLTCRSRKHASVRCLYPNRINP